ncbi:MAG: hypothetical protein HYX93_04770 [Chloroflexi bacterium]|nr:hypothetical protein [Chloroflexota bacterium]
MDEATVGFLIGFLVGIGASIVANAIWGVFQGWASERYFRKQGRVSINLKGPQYHAVWTDICGIVSIQGSRWDRAALYGASVPVSVELRFMPHDGTMAQVIIPAHWKGDTDESTITHMRPGSVREVILATVSGESMFPGSLVVGKTPLVGVWDLEVIVKNGDTGELYAAKQQENFVTDK